MVNSMNRTYLILLISIVLYFLFKNESLSQRRLCAATDEQLTKEINFSLNKVGHTWLRISSVLSVIDKNVAFEMMLFGEIVAASDVHHGDGLWLIHKTGDRTVIKSANGSAMSNSDFENISIEEEVLLYDSGLLDRAKDCFKKIKVSETEPAIK